MRRYVLLFVLAASPATAWEFSASPICTLQNVSEAGETVVTFDASIPEYTLAITLAEGAWPEAQVFAMQFLPSGPAISTDRHMLSDDGRTLTVRDRGFGNVLNGLQYNAIAVAILGDLEVPIALEGAAPEVELFRDCPEAGLV